MTTGVTIIFEKGEEGFRIASIPEIPGAFSRGRTKGQARANAFDSMNELMAAGRETAEPATLDAG
jgi:predicted RNase H-like HicB family nuclease